MAQTGYTPIQLYYSTTASASPTAGNLTNGELAINITDGKLFYKDNGGVVQTLATKTAAQFTWPGAGIPNSTGSAWGTSYTTSGSGTVIALATGASLTTPALSGETFSTSATVSAAGTTQGTATALTSDYNVVTTAAANSGVALPTATTGRRVIVVNKGANAVNVYPASGGTIDALSANAAISVPVNGYIEFNASSTTQWYSSFNAYISGTGVSSFSAGTTGLTPSTATTGAVTLAGTLAVANGGTGQTTYTNGQLLIGNTTGNTLTKATLTAGSNITITNGAGSITIAATGGATGGGTDKVFQLNGQTVTTTYSIPSGQNAMSVGPITVNSGVTVTVPSGSRWVVL